MSDLSVILDPMTGDTYWIDTSAIEEGTATICAVPAKEPLPSALRIPGWLVGLCVGLWLGAWLAGG